MLNTSVATQSAHENIIEIIKKWIKSKHVNIRAKILAIKLCFWSTLVVSRWEAIVFSPNVINFRMFSVQFKLNFGKYNLP